MFQNQYLLSLQGYFVYRQIITLPPFACSAYVIHQINQYPQTSHMVKFFLSPLEIGIRTFSSKYNTQQAVTMHLCSYCCVFSTSIDMMISSYDSIFNPFVTLWNPFRAFLNYSGETRALGNPVDAFAVFHLVPPKLCWVLGVKIWNLLVLLFQFI